MHAPKLLIELLLFLAHCCHRIVPKWGNEKKVNPSIHVTQIGWQQHVETKYTKASDPENLRVQNFRLRLENALLRKKIRVLEQVIRAKDEVVAMQKGIIRGLRRKKPPRSTEV